MGSGYSLSGQALEKSAYSSPGRFHSNRPRKLTILPDRGSVWPSARLLTQVLIKRPGPTLEALWPASHEQTPADSRERRSRRGDYDDYGRRVRGVNPVKLGPRTPLGDEWWIYGGTVTDILELPHTSYRNPQFWDLPLSLVADTVLLPMTIVQQMVGRPDHEDEETRPSDEPE